MRLLVDPAVFRHGRCGLTRYYASVYRGLQSLGVDVTIPLLYSNCDFLPKSARFTRWAVHIPKAAGLLNALSRRWFHLLVRRGSYDCILLTDPGFDSSFLRYKPDARFVMIVHDLMSCVTTPDGLYDHPGPGLMRLLFLAARASRVVCISEDTRAALLSHMTVPPERAGVVRTGNLLAQSNPLQAELVLPQRFLLFVGERSGRKGFYTLIRAFTEILQQAPDLHIVCTGTLTEEEKDYICRHTSLGRVHAIPADDGVLSTLYRRAFCLVYVSLYEGFGLPVLEAMQYGCPVITTSRGALAEVAGVSGILIDPEDGIQLRQAIVRLTQDEALAKRLRTQGQLHAQRFSTREMMTGLLHELQRAIAA